MMLGFLRTGHASAFFCEALVNIWCFQEVLAVKNRYSLRRRLSLAVKTFT